MSEIDFLKKEIIRTGYLVEMEVFSYLNSVNWLTTPHDYYFDYDLNVARDIDLHSVPYPYKPSSKFEFYPHLAIECKRSETNAWIFFKTKLRFGSYACFGQYVDLKKSQRIDTHFGPVYHTVTNLPHYYRSKLFSMSYTQVKMRKGVTGKLRNEIFEAVNQVTKYVSHQIEGFLDSYRKGMHAAKSCFFFLPIIVFDGKLYSAALTKKRLSLNRAKHVVLCTYYKPRYETRRAPFFIDIVERKYFAEYLSKLEKEICELNRKIDLIPDINEKFIEELQPERAR